MSLDWLIPDALSTAAFFFLVGLSYCTSAITSAFGIGGGVTLLAVMANLMPASAVIPVHAVVQLGSNLGRMTTLRGFTDWRLVLWFSLGSMVGAYFGGQVVMIISAGMIQLALGCFILYSAWLPIFKLSSSKKSIVFLGGGTSFVAMIVGGVAPFIFVVLKELFDDRRGLIATLAAMTSVQQVLKIGLFGFFGFVFADWYLTIALMVSTGYLGTLTGKLLLDRIPAEKAQPVLKFILTVMALRLVYMGVGKL